MAAAMIKNFKMIGSDIKTSLAGNSAMNERSKDMFFNML